MNKIVTLYNNNNKYQMSKCNFLSKD